MRGAGHVVGQRLQVGDEERLRDTGRLQGDARAQRAGQVPEVEPPRRPIAGENDIIGSDAGERRYRADVVKLWIAGDRGREPPRVRGGMRGLGA
ncbi:MAG: hypothetical protein AMXMBFR55_28500 [Gemmatimonadota bacterium]